MGALPGIGAASRYVLLLVAGDKFVGIAYEEIDNTGGTDVAKTVPS
jgi:hypothetical protein